MTRFMWFATVCLCTNIAANPDVPSASPGQGQDSGAADQDDGAEQDQGAETDDDATGAPETVVTETHRAVWTLLAQAAAKAGELPEDQTEKLIEIYVDARAQFADAEDAMRDEWKAEMRAKLEEQRAQGEVTGEIFDTTGIDHAIDVRLSRDRKKLAEAIVHLVEREVAEKVYPLLGGFDKRTDGAVNELMGYELVEDAELASVTALQEFYVETTRARELPMGEAGPAVRAAQETLIRALSPHLEREQLIKVARKAGVPFNE